MGQGVKDEDGFADDFLFGDEVDRQTGSFVLEGVGGVCRAAAPPAAVVAERGIIAHGVEVAGRNGFGGAFGHPAHVAVAGVLAVAVEVFFEGVGAGDGLAVAVQDGRLDL